MYLSVTQILKRLGKARNKKNADIVRDYLKTSGELIGGVFRVEEEVFGEYFGELIYELEKTKPFAEAQINSVTDFADTIAKQESRIIDLEIEVNKLTNTINKILSMFENTSKLKIEVNEENPWY